MSLYYTTMSVMAEVPSPKVAVEVVIADKDNASDMKRLESYAKSLVTNGNTMRLVHHTGGYHSFDTLQDTPETRQIVAGTLSFMVDCLEPDSR